MLSYARDAAVIFFKLFIKGRNQSVLKVDRKSDTLFILGSGTTINELTDEHFRIISRHDSFGFNFFLLHEFIPRFYMFEYIRDDEMRAIWMGSIAKYQEGPLPEKLIITESSYLKVKELYPEMYGIVKVLKKLSVVRNCQIGIENYGSLKILYFLRDMFFRNTYLQLRGSLTIALEFALKNQYKNIVLCGIDLDDKGYFYNNIVGNKDVGKMNSTVMPGKQGLTMDKNLKYLFSHYSDINFYVSSANSNVAKLTKVVDWDKFSQ